MPAGNKSDCLAFFFFLMKTAEGKLFETRPNYPERKDEPGYFKVRNRIQKPLCKRRLKPKVENAPLDTQPSLQRQPGRATLGLHTTALLCQP